jgi:hypothetical protein
VQVRRLLGVTKRPADHVAGTAAVPQMADLQATGRRGGFVPMHESLFDSRA